MIGDGTTYAPYRSQPLRQVMVPEALVDIIVLSRWEYELRFYHSENVGRKSGGYYSVAGQPYAVYRFKNPNPPAANRLEIAKIKDGREDRSEYSYDEASDSWQLMRNGQEVTRKFSRVDPNNPCERVETRFDMEDGKLSKTIKIYRGFPWGQELVRKVEDPDGKALTTTYSYFEDPDGPHYSFPKTTTHPDGRVERQSQQPDPTMGLKREP
jgi:hypothetical protein